MTKPMRRVARADASVPRRDGAGRTVAFTDVRKCMSLQGYTIVQGHGGRHDGGVDVLARRHGGDAELAVQCKAWSAPVPRCDVVAWMQKMSADGYTNGLFVAVKPFRFAASELHRDGAVPDGFKISLADASSLLLLVARHMKHLRTVPWLQPHFHAEGIEITHVTSDMNTREKIEWTWEEHAVLNKLGPYYCDHTGKGAPAALLSAIENVPEFRSVFSPQHRDRGAIRKKVQHLWRHTDNGELQGRRRPSALDKVPPDLRPKNDPLA
tara:strand:- start:963 stop:1763 length:801 start_codon:yes stop_codon:yes gene_type:complete